MIDHQKIAESYFHLKKCLEKREETNANFVYFLNEALPLHIIDELNHYFDNAKEDDWKLEQIQLTVSNEDQTTEEKIVFLSLDHSMPENCVMESSSFTRRALEWKHDTIIEELHSAFNSLSDTVGKIWNKKVKLHSINFWEDSANFVMEPHIDVKKSEDENPIQITIQIYINDSDPNSGTEFFNNDNSILDKKTWVKNSGYTLNNSPVSIHGVKTPGNAVRRSIYAIYY